LTVAVAIAMAQKENWGASRVIHHCCCLLLMDAVATSSYAHIDATPSCRLISQDQWYYRADWGGGVL
jgi:hypothetical protein